MNRKCQLPIQDDVSVYTYTYYGFANSIIQANAYSDNCIVKFEIVDKLQHNWTVNLHNFDVKKETDGRVIFKCSFSAESAGSNIKKLGGSRFDSGSDLFPAVCSSMGSGKLVYR